MILFTLVLIATTWQIALGTSDACSSSVTISNQSDADNLTSCDTFEGSITVSSSATGAITLNNVEEIKGSLIAEGVSGLTKLIAPDLDTIEGTLTISNLASFDTLTLSTLSRVSSGMTIADNPKLKAIGFAELEEIDGFLEMTGSFTSVALPALNQAKGQTAIQGASSMSCSSLNRLQSQGVFQGSYSCTTASAGLSGGAKGGIAVGAILGVILLLLALWFVIRRRQKRRSGYAEPTGSFASAPIQVEKASPPDKHVSAESEPQNIMPRKPVGSAILLDSQSIHEAPIAATPVHECHELDAGLVFSSHQRPIYTEQDKTKDPVTKENELGEQENGHSRRS
ncbi:uncharacterized protein N7511_007485 [Penicillium nucicola]|uniref:uncharacterized protein n=1 Tax=Penicillium nucicola TaxID=1850975 RepID=UPI002545AD2E|nr:uncharacterized protein N7511_007485 [Penicillium nucicola]KAJ5753332.1 hypothetical protein N7511_007485 [Penicillium nucicola]